ncbi:MAG: ClpXP protease specificity-enhancing factor SspB [Acetobacteraceae bacterium]
MSDDQPPTVESLLPYEDWTEAAMREVVVRAITFAAENGLPGEHHFYITFRTDLPGVVIPPRLRAQYPREMTIVLQHQFWDLRVDTEARLINVGLSFGGIPCTLLIPLGAVTAFADPYVRFGMHFRPETPVEAEVEAPRLAGPRAVVVQPVTDEPAATDTPQVVSLDAFRRRPPGKG